MIDLVIGLGEIGKPLADLLSLTRNVVRRDIESVAIKDGVDAMHVCFPYGDDFVDVVAAYIARYEPTLTVIHSTVAPGTTRKVFARTGAKVAYSPIRGRHGSMCRDLVRYVKYVSAPDNLSWELARDYFHALRTFHVKFISPVEALELAKLIETTYSGLLVTWAQEVDRFATAVGADMDTVLELTREVEWLPRHAFYPGYIGGHCIIPNLGLLSQVRRSPIVDAIAVSNEMCTEGQRADTERHAPRRFE